MFWSEYESQRLIVGCMHIKQERIKSMDFHTCIRQKAIQVLDSAVFANNSEMSSSTSRTRTSKLVFTMKDVCHTLPGQKTFASTILVVDEPQR